MPFTNSGSAPAGVFTFTCVLLSLAGSAQGQPSTDVYMKWDPIAEADLKADAPVLEKDAGIEAIFWRVHVIDEMQGGDIQRSLWHYVRLKVFNEMGQEKAAAIDIPFDADTSILYVAARSIKADGTISEMKKDAVHDRDLVRARGLSRKVKSFAISGVEPGAIVEYRWKEIRHKTNLHYLRLQLQREYPVRRVTYYVKPLSLAYDLGYQMATWPFNCKPSALKLEQNGLHSTYLENVPAFKEEPLMPAEPNIRPWILIFYHNKPKRDPDSYWTDVGKEKYRELKQSVKLSNEVKQAAEIAVAGAGTEEEKIFALIRHIRKNVRSLVDPSVTSAERNKWVKSYPEGRIRNSAEVLNLGYGSPNELNTLFAAMAQHAGLEARPVLVADRDDVHFTPEMADEYFLKNLDIAVKRGGEWKVYDVSTKLLSPSMVSWNEEATVALLSDPKKASFIVTPSSPPEASEVARTGRFKLDEDGALSGSVEERYTGHKAFEQRLAFDGESETALIEQVRRSMTKVFPRAEVSDVRVVNGDDEEQPLLVRYTLRIPSYAQRTGKRMFFQPLIFQQGHAPMFEAALRTHAVHFAYAWQESDDIAIDLPPAFKLDNAESPGTLAFGAPGSHSVELAIKGDRTLLCKRKFVFGSEGRLGFPRNAYATLKNVFDELHRRDNHVLSLKQGS